MCSLSDRFSCTVFPPYNFSPASQPLKPELLFYRSAYKTVCVFKIIILNEDLVPLIDPPVLFGLADNSAVERPALHRIYPDKDILCNKCRPSELDLDYIVWATGNSVIL
jgi:hypothetical protein